MAANELSSVFATCMALVYEELVAGRGVTIPDLGTFTIDARQQFKGPGGRSLVTRQPMLVLSASFQRLGVRLPAVRPSGTTAVVIIGWQALATRCAVDRDMAKRAVSSTVAAFVSRVAGMAASTSRSSATLDLGVCGKLRIVRCGDSMRTDREPRVEFSEALRAAVYRGPPPPQAPASSLATGVAAAATAAAAPSRRSTKGAAVPTPRREKPEVEEAAPSEAAAVDVADVADDDGSEQPFVTLAGLSYLSPSTPGWGACVSAAAAPAPAAQPRFARPAPAKLALQPPRQFAGALPLEAPEVNEWAVRKLQTARAIAAPRVLSESERRRRLESDIANMRAVQDRNRAKVAARYHEAQVRHAPRGVEQLLGRLPAPAWAATAADGEEDDEAAGQGLSVGGGVPLELLQRKAELENRLRELQRDIETASVR